jgi:hypothetical protein
LISWSEDFLARRFQSLADGRDSMTSGEMSFLRSQGFSKAHGLGIFCLRMSKDYSVTRKGKLSRLSSGRLTAWGMTASGKCLTAYISASHKTGSAYTLSDILEERPDPKYFLSDIRVKNIIYPTGKGST